jgi:hypothetical protein
LERLPKLALLIESPTAGVKKGVYTVGTASPGHLVVVLQHQMGLLLVSEVEQMVTEATRAMPSLWIPHCSLKG